MAFVAQDDYHKRMRTQLRLRFSTFIRRLPVWLGAVAVLGVGAGALAQAPADDLSKAPRIPAAEFKKLLDEDAVMVVDVRDEASYRAGHIPGAVSIPEAALPQRLDELKASKKPIVTYCA